MWFFIGWYEDDWFQKHLEEENINCTRAEMEEAAEGHFTTEALQWNQDHGPTISGQVFFFASSNAIHLHPSRDTPTGCSISVLYT